jgi:hypothetical protein
MDVNLNGASKGVPAVDIEHLKAVFQAHESSSYWIHNDVICFRSSGWRRQSYRDYLAAKGIDPSTRNTHTQHVHWNTREAYEKSNAPWVIIEEDDMDATEHTWLQRTHQRLSAVQLLADTVDQIGEPDEPNPLATAIKGIRDDVAEVKAALGGLAALTLSDAQVQHVAEVVAAALVAAADNPLGNADIPAIVAAVKQALSEGTGA